MYRWDWRGAPGSDFYLVWLSDAEGGTGWIGREVKVGHWRGREEEGLVVRVS